MPFLSKGLWRDLVNARELKARNVDGNFALLSFSHTMNQIKVQTLDLVPSPASVSEERAAREGAATGVGREFKVPVPDHRSL